MNVQGSIKIALLCTLILTTEYRIAIIITFDDKISEKVNISKIKDNSC